MRLAALAKAGFYATPPIALERITAMLAAEDGDGQVRVLDPCAGEGEAIATIADHLDATPYACELQRDRALLCKQSITYAVHGNALRLRLSPDAWSLLYLNPPYDSGAAANNSYEAKFLSDLDRGLAPGGILVYVVPINRIPAAAAHISGRYSNIQLYKFPNDEYETYTQVALFARKKGFYERNDDLEKYLKYFAQGLFILPELPPPGSTTITVRRLPERDITFEPGEIDKDALAAALASKYSAWNRPDLQERLWPSEIHRANPLMPLQRGHLAQLLAAGYLDNCTIDSDEGELIVKGQITKTTIETENNPDAGRRKERERLLVKLNVFNASTGQITSYEEEQLTTFVVRYRDALTAAVISRFPAQYNASLRGQLHLDNLIRTPIGGQADATRGLAWGLRHHKGLLLCGEMGAGKTYIATATAAIAANHLNLNLSRNLVACPPHLVKKWAREIKNTIPGARTVIIRTPSTTKQPRPTTQLDAAVQEPRDPKHPLFIIISREQLKLGYRNTPAAIGRRDPDLKHAKLLCCPHCWQPLEDAEGNPLSKGDLQDKRVHCLCRHCRESGQRAKDCTRCCGAATWSADGSQVRRYELARYLSKHYPKGTIDLLIADEAHEYKGEATAQGRAMGVLTDISRKCMALSGSIYTGMASDLFQLLYRFTPEFRDHFSHDDVSRFVERYGIYGAARSSETTTSVVGDGRLAKAA